MASSFNVSGGQIIGPNGQSFIAKGINIYADVLLSIGAATVTDTFPGLNFLRVNVFNMTADTAAALKPYVDTLTSKGVVVELEDHNFPGVISGGDLNYAAQRYVDWASTFIDNPNVWFGTQNEPDPNTGDVQNEISTIYQAIRSTGNNTIVMVNQDTPNGLNLSGMSNVVWDQHFYNNNPNSSNISGVQASLDRQVSADVAADNIPVVIGEYGPACANGIDPSGDLAVQVVQDSGLGSAAWAWETWNPSPYPGDLVNPPWTGGQANLTSYGQTVANFVASGVPSVGGGGTPPASVTGTGSDSLVLNISEDVYQGDAEFTVSVDGKQLGGTFTSTGSHAAGQEQSFTFKGDWAPGSHSVTVNFLNDAYGGTATTDRNLYVDKITYDGASIGQSLQLFSGGPQSFTLNDTTAIPVPSPDGTKITSAAASPIIDQAGNAWSLVQSTSRGLQIALNGTVDPVTQNVVILETLNGAMVQQNSAGNWYSESGPGVGWTQLSGNPNPVTPPLSLTPSPDGTKITSASASPIIDKSGNAWSLVQSASSGLQIAVNGTVDPVTANVVLLETLGGNMVQENTSGNWYSEAGPTGSWAQIAAPPLQHPSPPAAGPIRWCSASRRTPTPTATARATPRGMPPSPSRWTASSSPAPSSPARCIRRAPARTSPSRVTGRLARTPSR